MRTLILYFFFTSNPAHPELPKPVCGAIIGLIHLLLVLGLYESLI